jgi:hypothetical protein
MQTYKRSLQAKQSVLAVSLELFLTQVACSIIIHRTHEILNDINLALIKQGPTTALHAPLELMQQTVQIFLLC